MLIFFLVDNTEDLMELGGIESLVEILKRHPNNEKLVSTVSDVLEKLGKHGIV